jgi:hypothetical protein
MGLGEDSAIQSSDAEEQQAAIQNLQELVGSEFPAGTDGTNAVQSLKGIINDPVLEREIQSNAKLDADFDVRGLVKEWLESNAPEVLEQIDFGDYAAEVPAEVPAEEPVVQSNDNEQGREESSQMNIKQLAEFIHSFYDRESGTFPKGPEGVAIMVGKKFGEQAEMVARKMVERMAPEQQMPELNELARIKQLAGQSY